MDHEHIWQKWADRLQRWHLHGFAVWFLESLSPGHLVGAQFVYISQPILEMFVSDGQVETLVNILEQPAQAQAFAAYLRQDH